MASSTINKIHPRHSRDGLHGGQSHCFALKPAAGSASRRLRGAQQATVANGLPPTQTMIHSTAVQSCESAVKLHKLVLLSSKMASDAALARQLKRKFL